jgi:hypothetical protein
VHRKEKPVTVTRRTCLYLAGTALSAVLVPGTGVAQGRPPQPDGRWVTDWSSIVMLCRPTDALPWSAEACASIARDAEQRAAARGVPLVLVHRARIIANGMLIDDDDERQRVRAALIAPHSAVLLRLSFYGPQQPGASSTLDFNAQAGFEIPRQYPSRGWRSILFRTIRITAATGRHDAEAAVARLVEGLLNEMRRRR